MNAEYDVIVGGGGTAGITAAIQAGRAGARTLLVEKNAMLGGTMTVAGINAPAHFFAWGHQIIGGIGWELIRKTLEETRQPVPKPDEGSWHVHVDMAIFAALADEAVLAAGVEVLFHAMPATVTFADGMWTMQVCTKTGLQPVRTKLLIDATGDANVVGLAGFELVCSDIVQPATLTFGCAGYDLNALDYAALKAAADAAIAAGELVTTDISWRDDGPRAVLQKHGHNANHLHAPYAQTSAGKSLAEIEGRKALLRMYRFLRKQPGLENFRIDWICPEVGIRETVTIRGKKTITGPDYEFGKVYDDAVCYAFFPIDEHLHDGKGINGRPLKQDVVPTIPRGALLPANSRFLLVAGRCLASDREANSALRVECPCMAMGQAAGVMAALSARTGVDPEELPMEDVYTLLREHGAIVPGDIQISAKPAASGDAGKPRA